MTPDKVALIRKLRYEQNLSAKEVAVRMGLSIHQVRNAITRSGGVPKGRKDGTKWLPEILKEWRELRKQRWTYKEIAEKYNCNESTVANKLNGEI